MDRVYVHEGANTFVRSNFVPIKNSPDWIKPQGGLWASPEDAHFGWHDWKIANHYDYGSSEKFRFTLSPDAKLLVIDNVNQLMDLPHQHTSLSEITSFGRILDFEKLAQLYDAMLVYISEDDELHWQLYGWDCDSLLVFNPDVIELVR